MSRQYFVSESLSKPLNLMSDHEVLDWLHRNITNEEPGPFNGEFIERFGKIIRQFKKTNKEINPKNPKNHFRYLD